MDKRFYKIVLLPIVVTPGEYCWGPEKNHHVCCGHFDNEGGHPSCLLNIGDLMYTNLGNVKKPEECLKLKEA